MSTPTEQPKTVSTLISTVTLVAVLSAAWLLWSGIYKPMVLALGVLSVVIVVYLTRRMDFFSHASGIPRILTRLPAYWLWLLKEIVVSSWDVAKIVLSPSLPISPTLVTLKSGTDEELPQVIMGNSITLSPGTVTLDIDDGEIMVHCLTKKGADALKNGDITQRVRNLERPS